ncbi:hypothetical protein F4680DRAFT_442242 [Xylaria scruposa]|nr:hypothetical protein F4680DRAFT_442242 [Xylaria scruposa]
MSNKEGSAANTADGELKLDAQESKFFTAMIKLLPRTPNLDWTQLTAELDLKDGEVAKVLYHQIRRKHIYSALRAADQSITPKLTASKSIIPKLATRLFAPLKMTKPVDTDNRVSKSRRRHRAKQGKTVSGVSVHAGYDKDIVIDAQDEKA